MGSRLSLANKCLAIFGCAIILVIASTLTVPWARTSALVQDYQLEVSQQLADLWMQSKVIADGFEDDEVTIQLVYVENIDMGNDTFIERARNKFLQDNQLAIKHVYEVDDRNQQNYFQYARPITKSQIATIRNEGVIDFGSGVFDPTISDPIEPPAPEIKSTFS